MHGRILYIEDNPHNMNIVRKILRHMQYDVIEAVNGLSGITTAIRERPDMVLMDLHLPDISGLEATTVIKSTESLEGIPVIALTADTTDGIWKRCREAGCDGYLDKPITRSRLLKIIQQFANQPNID